MKTQYCDEIRLADFHPAKEFSVEFVRGLACTPKILPSKFFYDAHGSKLFDQICELAEYYPTRTENKILADNIRDIAALCGSSCFLAELGSGSSQKTRWLLEHLDDPVAYAPIDISRSHLLAAAARLSEQFFPLEILPVCADYNSPLELPVPSRAPQRTVVFFPGSTIGNFKPQEALHFLKQVVSWCQPDDGLLVGVDLRKEKTILERAYNDAKGITAAFNLNLLARANRELDADFALQNFKHRAIYNETLGRIEMHLVSRCRQVAKVGARKISFDSDEFITTEYSYKYSSDTFRQLACAAGWYPVKTWMDSRNFFSVHYLSLR